MASVVKIQEREGQRRLWHQYTTPAQLDMKIAWNSHFMKRFTLERVLRGHRGCVNTLSWNQNGDLLVSGSDDRHIIIWSASQAYRAIHNVNTNHTANIFSAKFLPYTSDHHLVSCAADGLVIFHNLERGTQTEYTCNDNMVYKCDTFPDSPFVFLSCSEDGTIRRYDIREAHQCSGAGECTSNIIASLQNGDPVANTLSAAEFSRVASRKIGINSIMINKWAPYKVISGGSDPVVREYDLRMAGTAETQPCRRMCPSPVQQLLQHPRGGRMMLPYHITSVAYGPGGNEAVASYSVDQCYLFDVAGPVREARGAIEDAYVRQFTGHVNVRTVKEANFFGPNGEYILSGSDCGRVFVWDKHTGEIVTLLKADRNVVNCMQGHPLGYPLVATSGIENHVKLWMPTAEEPVKMNEEGLDVEHVLEQNQQALRQGPRLAIPSSMLLELLALMETEGGGGSGSSGGEGDEDSGDSERGGGRECYVS